MKVLIFGASGYIGHEWGYRLNVSASIRRLIHQTPPIPLIRVALAFVHAGHDVLDVFGATRTLHDYKKLEAEESEETSAVV